MLQKTRGIVLRSVKYGDTSLISTIFTEHAGVQSYIVKGVRTASSKNNKAALLQPATLLDLIIYQQQNKNLQYLREFHPSFIYTALQENIVKNSIALFSVELLLRLLPEHAPAQELFLFAEHYFQQLDQMKASEAANLPVYFVIHCGRFLGYELKGRFSAQTPHLHLQEGGFSDHLPQQPPFVPDEDARALAAILSANHYAALSKIEISSGTRFRLLDWLLEFLHNHTQHLGQIKSLPVLRAVLH